MAASGSGRMKGGIRRLKARVLRVNLTIAAKGLPFFFATAFGSSSLSEPYRKRLILHKPFSRRTFLNALGEMLQPV